MPGSLWPATQLVVTCDISDDMDAVLHPRRQLGFLDEMAAFAGPGIFADSLVYSTPRGNTGWTAFRMGPLGHVAFHHWDMPTPRLLQLDVVRLGSLEEARALSAIQEFWRPLGLRAILIRRLDPTAELEVRRLRDDTRVRAGAQEGFGPGDHLHLLLDQIGPIGESYRTADRLSAHLSDLVTRLQMRGTTPVLGDHRHDRTSFEYDAIVGVTTSHVALRLRETGGRASVALDVFACRNFQPDVIYRWLDVMMPAPEARRAALYNRHPRGEFLAL